jgi:serine/threonine-protein kinase RsbW
MPFTSDDIDDIRLAVGEAVSNAIRHGCPKNDEDRLTVRCVGDTEKLVVEIHNPGQPFDPDSIPIPDPALLREGGMGIFFMRASMDQVNYNFDETGTTVIMTKFVGAEDAR